MEKLGPAKYISHLDLMRTMQRTFIRAGLNVKHTQGFNPHPYMAFALPLSVGVESRCELMDFQLEDEVDYNVIVQALNEKLPSGIRVISVYKGDRKFKEIKWLDIFAKLYYDVGVTPEIKVALQELFTRENGLIVEKQSKRGKSEVDILPLIDMLRFEPDNNGFISMSFRISAQDPSLNPFLIFAAIERYAPREVPDFYEISRQEIYDSGYEVFR